MRIFPDGSQPRRGEPKAAVWAQKVRHGLEDEADHCGQYRRPVREISPFANRALNSSSADLSDIRCHAASRVQIQGLDPHPQNSASQSLALPSALCRPQRARFQDLDFPIPEPDRADLRQVPQRIPRRVA